MQSARVVVIREIGVLASPAIADAAPIFVCQKSFSIWSAHRRHPSDARSPRPAASRRYRRVRSSPPASGDPPPHPGRRLTPFGFERLQRDKPGAACMVMNPYSQAVIRTLGTPDALGVEGRTGSPTASSTAAVIETAAGPAESRKPGFQQKKGPDTGTPQNGGALLQRVQ